MINAVTGDRRTGQLIRSVNFKEFADYIGSRHKHQTERELDSAAIGAARLAVCPGLSKRLGDPRCLEEAQRSKASIRVCCGPCGVYGLSLLLREKVIKDRMSRVR